MATKKKGCGLLITALVIFVIGGIIAVLLGKSAFSEGKKFTDDMTEDSVSFVTPETHAYTPEQDTFLTIWTTDIDSADLSTLEIKVIDQDGNELSTSGNASNNINTQHVAESFQVKKGINYTISATGLPDGETIHVSEVSQSAAISMLGKGIGAFAVVGIAGLISLILGIVGLVKFFSSDNKPQPAAQG